MKLDKPINQYTLQELLSIVRNTLNISYNNIHLTGSRYYGTNKSDADYDFIIYEPLSFKEFQQKYFDLGFEPCSDEYALDPSKYFIVRDANNINLIVTNNPEKYEKRISAATLCKLYKLPKDNIVAIHNALLQEGLYDNSTPF